MVMTKEYYSNSIAHFIKEDSDQILGKLLANDVFETTDLQKNAWKKEISILQQQLVEFPFGSIIFEYTIPRVGSRIDTVCIINGIVFLLEFKVGDKEYRRSGQEQVMDYALDLKYFHEESRERYIVPILIATEAEAEMTALNLMNDNILEVICCNKSNIGIAIKQVLSQIEDHELDLKTWIASRYMPTPTIIEAAQALYRNHSVDDISRNDAGVQNLTLTTNTINEIIDTCKKNKEKAICFVTGVPGAGKTLAGLNIANARHQFEESEHAIFLSGNGPLVDVLQEALARDKAKGDHITKDSAKRETKAFIQIIHKFRDEAFQNNKPPIEKVVIFDEAQRAWDERSLSKFMNRKKGIADFHESEPDFLISIMDRHQDWSTVVCLVGGGQEIYTGEAGIVEWFKVLKEKYPEWNIYLSHKMEEEEYTGGSSLNELLGDRKYNVINELHLGTSLRSFRSEKLSAFVKELLDNNIIGASELYGDLKEKYPLVLTRDLEVAKRWVRTKARGTERYGLLASSEGKRLRANGIWVPTTINHIAWFLDDKNKVDSSYYLEVAASEFKVQGLEIDYGILAWDADFRYCDEKFNYYRFRGANWCNIKMEQRKRYLKNAYRVLLTRARQGLVIYIPRGSDIDATTAPELYDETYNYLKQIGICEL